MEEEKRGRCTWAFRKLTAAHNVRCVSIRFIDRSFERFYR